MIEQKQYMQEANTEAQYNLKNREGGPFGAVIVKNGKIIGRGHNRVLKKHDPTAHGEIEAIRDACQALGTHDLSGCEIYTSCYPCPMCLSAIIWANIKHVYYGNTAKDAAAIGFRDDYIYQFIESKQSNKDILELIQIDRESTIKTFEEFQKDTEKELY